MNCPDAREQFTALVNRSIALTEWAQIEAHVAKCAACRNALERLYKMKPRHEPDWSRPLVESVDQPLESPDVIEVMSPGRGSWRSALRVTLIAVALILGMAAGLGVYLYRGILESSLVALLERVHMSRPAEVASNLSPATSPETASRATRPDEAAVPSPPSETGVRETAPALVPQTKGPETTPAPSPGSRPSTTPMVKDAGPAKGRLARELPPRPSRAKPDPSRSPSGRVATPTPGSTSELPSNPGEQVQIGTVDVAVQVSVQDRRDAERDLSMLLARLGGTKVGNSPASTLVVTVPRASYGEFTRGLAQMGSWQLEAGRTSLPDPVHVAVKLAK